MTSDEHSSICRQPDMPLMELTGQMDFRTVGAVSEKLLNFVRIHRRVCIRAGGVDFIDSSGLSMLIDAAKLARDLGGTLWLADPAERITHVLRAAGFQALFGLEQAPPSAGWRRRRMQPLDVRTSERTFMMPCRADTVAVVITKVAEFAARLPFDEYEIDDIRLAVGEAVSNAYRHGCTVEAGVITVICRTDVSGLTVLVQDRGKGFDPDSIQIHDPTALAAVGKGIYFIRVMMDEVSFKSGAGGTLVRMFKSL